MIGFHVPSWFWLWLVLSMLLWFPIARGFHPTGFTRAWVIVSVIWWLPIALVNLLSFATPEAAGGIGWDSRLIIRCLLYIWFALGLLISGLSFWEWWTWRHP
jgi:hypothetical protein